VTSRWNIPNRNVPAFLQLLKFHVVKNLIWDAISLPFFLKDLDYSFPGSEFSLYLIIGYFLLRHLGEHYHNRTYPV
jgi:hypothetical protein